MCADPYSDGMAYRNDLSRAGENKAAISGIHHDCQSVLSALKYHIFMGVLALCFYHTEYIQSIATSLGTKNVLLFIFAFVGVNGVVEAAVCFVVGAAISAALKKALRTA